MADFGNTLRSATRIIVRDRAITRSNTIGGNDTNDILRFRIGSQKRLTLSLNRSRADLELIKDKNNNRRIDPGEILASSRATGRRAERIRLNRVDPGTYYIRVLSDGTGRASYRLTTVADRARSRSIPEQVFGLVNRHRTRRGLPTLALNTQLNTAARRHSNSMAVRDFYSHTDDLGRGSRDRIIAANYDPGWSGENIAAGYTSSNAVMRGWMNSTGHRNNILSVNYTEIGIGYRYLGNDNGSVNYNYYWTQNFGSY